VKSSQEDIILLEKYLQGKLEGPIVLELEARISTEKDLAEDYDTLKTLSSGIRLNVLQDKLKFLEATEAEKKTGTEDVIFNNKFIWIVLTLALASFLLTIYFLTMKTTSVDTSPYALNDGEFYTYIRHTNERSIALDSNLEKSKAYNLFTAKEFELARPLLLNLWESKKDTLAYYYLAISHLQLNNFKNAYKILTSSELVNYETETLLKKCDVGKR